MSTRSYGRVTQAVWNCVKSTRSPQHGTRYDPPDANQAKGLKHERSIDDSRAHERTRRL
jgi:hypothetical protein